MSIDRNLWNINKIEFSIFKFPLWFSIFKFQKQEFGLKGFGSSLLVVSCSVPMLAAFGSFYFAVGFCWHWAFGVWLLALGFWRLALLCFAVVLAF